MTQHTRRAALVAGLLVGLLALTTALYGAMRIGGWSFAVNGQVARNYQYTGGCPVDLTFDWGVINSNPAAITYWTSRNDNARSSPRSRCVRRAGHVLQAEAPSDRGGRPHGLQSRPQSPRRRR